MRKRSLAAWVNGVVVGIFDAWGKSFAVWVPTYAQIGAASAAPPRPFPKPLPIGTDIVVDGGFEQGTDHWTPLTLGTSIERGSANVISGAASLKMDHSVAAAITIVNSKAPGLVQESFGLPGGFDGRAGAPVGPQLMTISGTCFWVSPNGTTEAGIDVDIYDQTGAGLTTLHGPGWITETTPTKKTVTVILPAGAGYAVPQVNCSVAGIGGQAYMDDVHVVASGVAASSTTLQGTPGTAGGTLGTAPLLLNHQTNVTVNSGTTLTYVLPGGALSRDGQMLRIVLRGNKGATVGAPNLLVTFGATTVLTQAMPTGADVYAHEILVVRTGATTQVAIATGGRITYLPPQRSTPGETLSANITITVSGSTAGDNIVVDQFAVEHRDA